MRATARASHFDAEAEADNYLAARLALQADVAQTYFRVIGLRQEASILKRNLAAREEVLKLTRNQQSVGEIDALPVSAIETDVANVKADAAVVAQAARADAAEQRANAAAQDAQTQRARADAAEQRCRYDSERSCHQHCCVHDHAIVIRISWRSEFNCAQAPAGRPFASVQDRPTPRRSFRHDNARKGRQMCRGRTRRFSIFQSDGLVRREDDLGILPNTRRQTPLKSLRAPIERDQQ